MIRTPIMVLALRSPIGSGRSEVLKARSMARIALGVLWGSFLALYFTAKFDFFVRYDPFRVRTYLHEHSIYWVGMAALAFVIWLIEK